MGLDVVDELEEMEDIELNLLWLILLRSIILDEVVVLFIDWKNPDELEVEDEAEIDWSALMGSDSIFEDIYMERERDE